MKRLLILAVLSVLCCQRGVTQNLNQPLVFQSPQVSALVNEVNTPVSLSSGTVKVNVPLYNLQFRDIEVPISLGYDASGIKVDAQPSIVGQNWSLRAGGTISRIVKGAPDETFITMQTFVYGMKGVETHFPLGYMYHAEKLKGGAFSQNDIQNWAEDGDFELEPDEFIFNMCGHTGKFYFTPEGGFRCNDDRYVIDASFVDFPLHNPGNINLNDLTSFTYYIRNYLGSFPAIMRIAIRHLIGFCITAPDGYRYYFGAQYRIEKGTYNPDTDQWPEIEQTADFFAEILTLEHTAWNLERIVSPAGNTVEFKYDNKSKTVSFSKNYSYVNSEAYGKTTWGWFLGGGSIYQTQRSFNESYSGRIISHSNLKEIRTKDASVKFNYSTANTLKYNERQINAELRYIQSLFAPNIVTFWHGQMGLSRGQLNEFNRPVVDYDLIKPMKLDKISIQSIQSAKTIKNFEFQYNGSSSSRMQLLSVQEYNNDQSLPPTTFHYNDKPLSDYLSDSKDHWGYYNGKNAVIDFNSTISMEKYYSLREPDPKYTNAEILEMIDYPTGGSKRIIYEPNVYSRVVCRDANTGDIYLKSSNQRIGGGLRIKEIIEYSESQEHLTKYTYSPGILNAEAQYYWKNYAGILLNGNAYSSERFMSTSLLPVSNNAEGGSVSYSNVTEWQSGNGRIEYVFSNHDTYPDENAQMIVDPQKSPYTPLSSMAVRRGRLLETKIYKEGAKIPYKRAVYTYKHIDRLSSISRDAELLKWLPSVYIRGMRMFGASDVNAIEGCSYKIWRSPFELADKVEYTYADDGQCISKKYCYDYGDVSQNGLKDYYGQLTSVKEYDTNDSLYKTEYFYYPTAISLNSLDVYKIMAENLNIVSPVIINQTYLSNQGQDSLAGLNINVYNINDSTSLTPSIVKQHVSHADYDNAYVKYYFDRYNSQGNIVQVREQGGTPVCYIWGYGGRYVVAEVKNATFSQLKSVPGLASFDRTPLSGGIGESINNALRALDNILVTTYTYKPLVGVTSVTDPSGRTTSYEYDDLGRLIIIKDDRGNVLKSYEYNY